MTSTKENDMIRNLLRRLTYLPTHRSNRMLDLDAQAQALIASGGKLRIDA